MFTVSVGSLLTTVLFLQSLWGHGEASPGFTGAIACWLWFTVLFANFAEAMAEGRGKAQADSLRRAKRDIPAKKLAAASREAAATVVSSAALHRGDLFLVEGRGLPSPATARSWTASPRWTNRPSRRIRPGHPRRPAATARPSPAAPACSSDWLVVRVTAEPGQTFLDRMIAMVGGAKRRKTPNEIATQHPARRPDAHVFLVGVRRPCIRIPSFAVDPGRSRRGHHGHGAGGAFRLSGTHHHRLDCSRPSASPAWIGCIAANVIAMSGRAVEAAGDVDVLLLDKTGTITLGNRQAADFCPRPGSGRPSWPTPPSWPPWPTRPPRAAPSWSWPRSVSACAAGT